MEVIKIFSIKNSHHSTLVPVIPPSFHHLSIILSSNLRLFLGKSEDIIPDSVHHSWVIHIIQSSKSVHPSPSAEGDGWTDLGLSLGMTEDIIPDSVHHSKIIHIILSSKSVQPSPSAEGDGWTDLKLSL